MTTKKFYPMHPEIRKALELYQCQPIDDFDHEGAIEWVDDSIDQLMNLGLLRVSLTEEYPDRRFASIKSTVRDFLLGLKTAIACGAIQIETRPAENQEPEDIAPMLCQKQIITLTDHGWNVFSRLFPEMKKHEDENDDYDESKSEYTPAETPPPDDRARVLSSLYQKPWQPVWGIALRGWSQEQCDLLIELEKQDLIEGQDADKTADDVNQKFMLTPLGAHTILHERNGYNAPIQHRSRETRRLTRQARSLLEKIGCEIQGLCPRILHQRIYVSDIVAHKDGKRMYAMVESEEFSPIESLEKYQAFWNPGEQGRITNNMYVFCQNSQVLRDVMYLVNTHFDIKPPAIYLCNLEEVERVMQTKGHPWAIVQVSREQESGTIAPKENKP